jgi:hypothetical protein
MDEAAKIDRVETPQEPVPWRLRRSPPRPALSEVERRWQRENEVAIDSMNAWVEEHGLPLEKFQRR